MSGPTTGNLTKAILKLGSAWGTAVAPATTDGIRINEGGSENFSEPPFMSKTSDQPAGNRSAVSQGLVSASKTIMANLNYNDLRFLAYVFGNGTNYTAPVEQTGGQGDYLHVVVPADDIYGLFFTYAEQHGSLIKTFPSNKGMRFMLSGEAADDLHVKYEFEFAAYDRVWDNAVINSSHFTSLTYPAVTDVMFDQLVWRINDADGSALASGDALGIRSFSFSYRRVLAADLYDNASSRRIIEPPNNGIEFDLISLTVERNYFDSTWKDFIGDLKAHTPKKFDLTFTGSQIGSGYNYTWLIECPCAWITDPADSGNYTNSGLLPASMTLNIVRPSDALTSGMTFSDAVKISVTDEISAKQVS